MRNKTNPINHVIKIMSYIAITSSIIGTAHAQTALEEVVVVATKRSENLQDVPIAISAHTADSLASNGIEGISNLDLVTPGLVVSTQGLGQLPYMRGVGSNDGTPGQELPIAVYVDGVYQPTIWTNNIPFNNVERVEVLKGPQGTLFGRNATGGLIHVITKEPTQEFEGDASISYGNYDTVTVKSYVAGGVSDNVAADLAFYYKDQSEGWGKNLFNGDDIYTTEELALRSKWVFDLGDATKITAIGDYLTSEGNNGYNYRIIPGGLSIDGISTATNDFYDINSDLTQSIDIDVWSASVRIEHDFGAMNFMSLSSYQESEVLTDFDNDATTATLVHASTDAAINDTFTQEFQLLGETDHFRWITGLFFMDMEAGFGGSKGLQIFGALSGVAPVAINLNNTIKTKSYAVFAELGFDLGDSTRLTVGARYSRDERQLKGQIVIDGAPGGNMPLFVATDVSALGLEETFSDPSYRLILDHDLSEDVMVYASFSHGFKSGNFNVVNPANDPFDSEELDAYEIGLKGRFFENTVQLNGAAFYYDYTNLQLVENVGNTTNTTNAAEATIYGLELDITAALSDALRLNVGYTYLNSEYEDFPAAACFFPNPAGGNFAVSCDASGNGLVRAPENVFNIGLNYHTSVANGELAMSANYYYNSGMIFTPEERLQNDSYGLLNGRIKWTDPNERYSVSLYGQNILDEEWVVQLISQALGDYQVAGNPRIFGIELGINF